MTTMRFYISFCVIYFVCTISNDLTPDLLVEDLSIPEQLQSMTTRSATSLTLKSHPSNIMNNDEFRWNGGIVLTSDSNKMSQKGRSQTTIAATRCNNLIFVGFNSAQGFCFFNDENDMDCPGVPDGFENGIAHYSVSFNGGKTWGYMYAPPPLDTNTYTSGDPWMSMGGTIADDAQEYLYFVSVALNKSDTHAQCIGLVVHVARIIYEDDDPTKSAINFEWIRASLISDDTIDDNFDKPAIAADPFDSSKAYVSVTNEGDIPLVTRDIEVYSTHNAGVSWEVPAVLWEDPVNETFPRLLAHYSMPVVGANGNVYVIWQERELSPDFIRTLKYRFKKSTDGGQTFIPEESIVINPDFTFFNPIGQVPVAHNRRWMNIQATIDIFTTIYRSNQNYFNRIIIAHEYALTDELASNIDGFIDDNNALLNSVNFGISYSDDEGHSWHFVDPFTETIPERFVKRKFPTVSVSSNGRSVNVAYIEVVETKMEHLCIVQFNGFERSSFYHSIADHYYIHSDDGGVTWSDPIKLTEFSVDWCVSVSDIRPNFGDYMSSISDSRGGVQVAGQTNGFTVIEGSEPKTAVDVMYFYSKREICEETKDCFAGKKKKDRKITCSENVKWNYDLLNIDNVNGTEFCCVQNNGMCQTDNDCCGGQTQCVFVENDYKCLNAKQWRAINVNNGMIDTKHQSENGLLAYWDDKNVDVEIQLPWILIVIGMCCIAFCFAAPFFIWMQMTKQ